ncbi:exodeoxyribonuclease 7 large subunit [Pseudoclavibacter endophyticus]|uniref:Exodeoxyribonuclease 7 large subunit n=2 Tax=Pseudoclavibacter endophyticus TaxID=1778590 RepID=A0A6H9WMX6_9MICO|nr:exodeoxyribonuclease VII large subunit [Pseudoclavibacter endophyticus]GGA60564.1 exodeoxyribonuclease 7 large subunit [Pseudoclavibacter endophyticus]
MSPPPSSAEAPWTVATVSSMLRDWISRLGAVWIEGELTSWNVRGGHVYAKLRDLEGDATLSVNVWRSVAEKLDGEFSQGDRVIVHAKPDFWVKGGTLSLQAYDVRHVGLGELLERLERLRRQLSSEGLFDPARKRALPFLPGTIGLVTGRDSDAEKDVRRNAELRWPAVRFRTIHTLVQGDRAAADVASALLELDGDSEVDVIIVARGGGDFLHLLPFSDESLVRVVASLATPVVSAIGHEADRPLLDEVADLRASTPTDAAKRVVPDVAEQLAIVQQGRSRAFSAIANRIASETRGLEQLRSRPAIAHPSWIVDQRGDELMRYAARADELIVSRVDREGERVRSLATHLRALSPQRTLDRGYAIVERIDGDGDGDAPGRIEHRDVVRSWSDAPTGAALRIRLADGRVEATATGGEPIETPAAGRDGVGGRS